MIIGAKIFGKNVPHHCTDWPTADGIMLQIYVFVLTPITALLITLEPRCLRLFRLLM